MFINNRLVSCIYKVCLIVVCLVGLVMSSGLTNGTFAPYVLLYYTILSNVFCLLFYIASALFTFINIKNTGKYGVVKFAPHFKGGVVMAKVLTMLFYFFILSSGSSFADVSFSAVLANILVHLVVPLMVIVDWVLFDRKGRFFGSDPIIWTAAPFLYYAVVLVAAQAGVQYYGGASYPYQFINPANPPYGEGWAKVLVSVFLLTLAYVAVGYIQLGADRLLGKYAKKKALAAAYSLPDVDVLPDLDEEAGASPEEELQSLTELLGHGAGQATPMPAAAAQPAAPNPAPAARTARPVGTPVPTSRPAPPARAMSSAGGKAPLER